MTMRILLTMLTVFSFSQPLLAGQRILDIGPSGRPNERAVIGGSQPVEIETNVPLAVLIKRLEGNWKEEVTTKGYWIGYTDDMFSIAAHGEDAIAPLLNFIKNTSSEKAHYGALLSLHLIGIESTIAGRFYEEFKSEKVRAAFYGLLENPKLRDQVLLLLVRDPWPTDLPHVFKLLTTVPDENCRPTVNGLFRYSLGNPAFGGTLSEEAEGAQVVLVQKNATVDIGTMRVITRELPGESSVRINQINNTDKNIVIQSGKGRKGWVVWKFQDPAEARNRFLPHYSDRDVHAVVGEALRNDQTFTFRYCDLDDPFNYSVVGTNVYIISPAAAKVRWLDWWKQLSDEQKSEVMDKRKQKGSTKATSPAR